MKDEAVKTCFYFALRNTLVAKDIDQATRIGYGKTRYRVVTLKGELIELSGETSREKIKKKLKVLNNKRKSPYIKTKSGQ